MKIAFDAKRAYQNNTGLGHYSRTLISSLANLYAQHQYYLCAPKITPQFSIAPFNNVFNITPESFAAKKLKSAWRSNWVKKDLHEKKIDLYHGLSNEIPVGIIETGIKSVVTIHDLIFERYPNQYNWIDVQIYRSKFKYACTNADRIIAISTQTKEDIISFYKIPAQKIDVCYQSCNPAFTKQLSDAEKNKIKLHYKLPDKYFLYVGSIIERKNLLNICKAMEQLKGTLNIPLVVIGDGGKYKQAVIEYCLANGLQGNVFFLADNPVIAKDPGYRSSAHFPAIYQSALCMIYPSVFEGFGIPVLEALYSRLPVITSNLSCLPETGGNAALYVDPHNPSEIANALLQVASNETLRKDMIEKGIIQAQKFTPEKCAADVMRVYLRA